MDLSFSKLQTLFSSKAFLTRIPFKVRLALIAAFFVICWTLWCQQSLANHRRLQSLSAEISTLSAQALKCKKQKELYQTMQKQNSLASPDYLAQVVESIPLLEGEKKRVSSLAKQFPDNSSLKERISFLDTDQNRIHFDESGNFSRVQMDVYDLRKFLEAVEGDRYDLKAGKPFLLIKRFDLLKSYEKGDEKVYSVQGEILKTR